MVGFHYASVSVDLVTKAVTVQCEDADGQCLTAEGADVDAAVHAMTAKLAALVQVID
jgi:alkaline phosphatase